MPVHGDSLGEILRDAEKETRHTGERLADAMVDHGNALVARNTPVETYHLRHSYKRTPITYEPTGGLAVAMYCWTGMVFTEVEYAPYVEFGTGLWGPRHAKYKIAPKTPGGVLVFEGYSRTMAGAVILDVEGKPSGTGRTVFARFVMHPGSPGHHMFQIGATLTEHEKDQWSAYPLELWEQHIESSNFNARAQV